MTGVCNVTASEGNEIFERIAIATDGDVYDYFAPDDEYSTPAKTIVDVTTQRPTTKINDNGSTVEPSESFESSTVEIEPTGSIEATEITESADETYINDATYEPRTEANGVNTKPQVYIDIMRTDSTESIEIDDEMNKSKTTFSVIVPKQQMHIDIVGSAKSNHTQPNSKRERRKP